MAIRYQSLRVWKYRTVDAYRVKVEIDPRRDIQSSGAFVTLDQTGTLSICKGYAWDGPSGPTIDTRNFMRGSLVHDALYQLIREGLLAKRHRAGADRIMRRICLEDGMSRIRAWWVYVAVRRFGAAAVDPKRKKAPKIRVAP